MAEIDLLSFVGHLKIKEADQKKWVFDIIRKKYIILQPEEMVRQLCVHWLIHEAGFSKNLIQVEKLIVLNGLKRRFDIVVYNQDTEPFLLVECKAPDVLLNQKVFDQLAAYQTVMSAPFLMVTNGQTTYIGKMNHLSKTYDFFDGVPNWVQK